MSQNQNTNSNQSNNQEIIYGDPVFVYTSDQAVEDGVLFDVTVISPKWKEGMFNYVTVNLLLSGYLKDNETINIPNLVDLLVQAQEIVRKATNNYTVPDTFFSGSIELPSGAQQQIFISQNESDKFTIMLPEDY